MLANQQPTRTEHYNLAKKSAAAAWSRTCLCGATKEIQNNLRDWDCQAWVLLAEAETNQRAKDRETQRKSDEEWKKSSEYRRKKQAAVKAKTATASARGECERIHYQWPIKPDKSAQTYTLPREWACVSQAVKPYRTCAFPKLNLLQFVKFCWSLWVSFSSFQEVNWITVVQWVIAARQTLVHTLQHMSHEHKVSQSFRKSVSYVCLCRISLQVTCLVKKNGGSREGLHIFCKGLQPLIRALLWIIMSWCYSSCCLPQSAAASRISFFILFYFFN